MRPYVRLLPLVALLTLGACQEDLPTRPQTRVLLAEEEITISGGQGSTRNYILDVPAGTARLRVILYGGTGDADIAIRFGQLPSTTGADCTSETEYDIEECIIEAPQAGTWYVQIYGYSAYSNVRLVPNLYTVGGVTPLASGVDVSGLSGAPGDFAVYELTVPAGADSLVVTLDATGDPDLYLDVDRVPTLNNYACASFTATGAERCVVAAPTAGVWKVRIEAYDAYSAGTLRGTIYSPTP